LASLEPRSQGEWSKCKVSYKQGLARRLLEKDCYNIKGKLKNLGIKNDKNEFSIR